MDSVTLGYFIYTLGSIFPSSVPILESKTSEKMHMIIEDMVEVQAQEISEIDESPKAKQFRLYHHTLEKMEEPKDSEGVC